MDVEPDLPEDSAESCLARNLRNSNGMDRRVEIFCPKCKWEPRQEDLWVCKPGCSCEWNTFDTCGVCPDCGKVFDWTTCLSCGEDSPHSNWYHHFGRDPVTEKKVVARPA